MTKETAGEQTISYTYDKNGNPLTVSHGDSTITRTFDKHNRVLTKSETGMGKAVYAYDKTDGVPEGFRYELSTDPKGNKTKKVYDKAGRLSGVYDGSKLSASYEYYNNGAQKQVKYASGVNENYTYFPDGTLKSLVNKNSDEAVIDSYSYTYDNAGNQLTKTDSNGITSYSYDEMNRLKTVAEPSGKTTEYTYDANGNRTLEKVTESEKTTTISYTYDNVSNRLVKTAENDGENIRYTDYVYDGNGNTVAKLFSETATANAVKNMLGIAPAGTKYSELYEYDKPVLELEGENNENARNVYGTSLVN